jgi:hypothetical protein
MKKAQPAILHFAFCILHFAFSTHERLCRTSANRGCPASFED